MGKKIVGAFGLVLSLGGIAYYAYRFARIPIERVLIAMLVTSAVLFTVVFLYRRLLKSMSKELIDTKHYCVLYALENDPASGELEFYFTSEEERDFKMLILDSGMNQIRTVVEKTASPGGNIVRFDSTTLSNGEYYFCLKTENQKTMKKMRVLNS